LIVRQRGRKGVLQRSVVPIPPDLEPVAPPRDRRPPPDHLGPEEEELWYEITDQYDFRGVGHSLFGLALHCLFRARQCEELIRKDGGPLLISKRGGIKRHPLLGAEVSNRKLARSIFKQLKIPVRGDLFD
jgi:hypothetical protein